MKEKKPCQDSYNEKQFSYCYNYFLLKLNVETTQPGPFYLGEGNE